MTKDLAILNRLTTLYIGFCWPKISQSPKGELSIEYEWTSKKAEDEYYKLIELLNHYNIRKKNAQIIKDKEL